MLPARRSLYRSKDPSVVTVSTAPSKHRDARAKTAEGGRHIAWVKGLECGCCEAAGPSDAHHPRDDQGGAQRAPDFLAIPLCKECHQGPQGIHGDRTRLSIRKLDESIILSNTIRKLRMEIGR